MRGWAAGLLLLVAGCDLVPPLNLERMIDQKKVELYEETPFLPDDRGTRPPPPGTVPSTRVVGDPKLTTGREADGASYVDEIPMPLTRATLERGRERFDINCAPCHGARGDGVSQVAENMQLRRPPSLLLPPVRGYPSGRLFAVITEGYGLMPRYGHVLHLEDRWAVVAYVKALQLSQNAVVQELPATVRKEAEGKLHDAVQP